MGDQAASQTGFVQSEGAEHIQLRESEGVDANAHVQHYSLYQKQNHRQSQYVIRRGDALPRPKTEVRFRQDVQRRRGKPQHEGVIQVVQNTVGVLGLMPVQRAPVHRAKHELMPVIRQDKDRQRRGGDQEPSLVKGLRPRPCVHAQGNHEKQRRQQYDRQVIGVPKIL